MKISSLLAIALALPALFGTAEAGRAASYAPVKWQDVAPRARRKLPAQVGARLPSGAVTLHLGRLPIGPKGAPMLVHIWTARRRSEESSHWPMEQSPICVDVFAQGRASFTRTASAVFLSDEEPEAIGLRWLYASKKQGPVLILTGNSYMSTKYTLVVFPNGVSEENLGRALAQDFYQGGVGGGKMLQYFGVDSSGTMTVETEDWANGKLQSNVVRHWNGYEFQAPEGESDGG